MPVKKTLTVKSPKVRAKFISEEIPADQIDAEAQSIRSLDESPEQQDITIDEKEEDKDFWKGNETKSADSAEESPRVESLVVEKEEAEEDSEPQELGFLARNGGSSSTPFSKLLWIVLAVALFVGGIGGGVLIFRQGVEAGKKEASLVTPTPSSEDLQTTVPEPTPALNRGNLTVQVLNGAGIPGTAKKAETFLADLGYKVGDTANAKSFDYDKTVISLKESKKEYSQIIIKDLSEEYEIDQTPKVLPEDSEFDVIIVIGKK